MVKVLHGTFLPDQCEIRHHSHPMRYQGIGVMTNYELAGDCLRGPVHQGMGHQTKKGLYLQLIFLLRKLFGDPEDEAFTYAFLQS